MTKYILKEKIPNTSHEVGHVFETDILKEIIYFINNNSNHSARISPHEILMMTKLGILEEVGEECSCCDFDIFLEKTKSKFAVFWSEIESNLPKSYEMAALGKEKIYQAVYPAYIKFLNYQDQDLIKIGDIISKNKDAQKALDEIVVMLKNRK